ncbi:MAG: thioredoxin family protein [Epsilonproteobacteria bacterium]|nr:thioredoxin family protein [Campylobacterota bacterium]
MLFKKFLLIFMVFLTAFTYANEDLNTTTEVENKITLLYIDDVGCKYCRELDLLMENEEPAKLLNKHFVIKRMMLNEDLELPEGLPEPFGSPTIYFLDVKDKALVEPMRGEKSEEELIWFLEEAVLENEKLFPKKEKSFWGSWLSEEE